MPSTAASSAAQLRCLSSQSIRKIPATVLLDVAGMGVIIGQLVGRWGNFMNREAHGAVTDTFLENGPVRTHPAS